MFLNLSFVIEKEIIYLSQVRQQQRSAMCISLTRCCHQRYASWLGHLLRSHSVPGKVVFLYTPLPPPSYFVRLSFQLSVCSFVHVLDQYFLKHSTIFFFFLPNLVWAVYYHEVMCNAEKLVHSLQGQGPFKDLCDQNMTFFFFLSYLRKS